MCVYEHVIKCDSFSVYFVKHNTEMILNKMNATQKQVSVRNFTFLWLRHNLFHGVRRRSKFQKACFQRGRKERKCILLVPLDK